MATRIVAPGGATPETAPVEGVTKPAELTAAQYRVVLEVIAGQASTLHQLIMLSNDECQDQFVRGVCGDAADALARHIGAMADEAVDAGIVGDANRWNYGPNFDGLGKEASHG